MAPRAAGIVLGIGPVPIAVPTARPDQEFVNGGKKCWLRRSESFHTADFNREEIVSKTLEPQRKRVAIAMTERERGEYLGTARTCRLASVSSDGVPHVSPLWFVWDGEDAWIYSIVKSQRWMNIISHSKVALVVDGGEGYEELQGVEITGTVTPVGEIPRVGTPNATLENPEKLFAEKYSRNAMAHDGRHAWLRIVPDKIVSWDFSKLSSLKVAP
jgi:hypothetical protein